MAIALKAVSEGRFGKTAPSSGGFLKRFGTNLKRNIKTSDILSGVGTAFDLQAQSNFADLIAKGQIGSLENQAKLKGINSLESAETNALIAESNIRSTQKRFEFAAARKIDAFNRLADLQLAKFGISGVESGTGTPAMVMDETRILGEIEAAAIRLAGFEAVENLRLEASFARLAGKEAKVLQDLREQFRLLDIESAKVSVELQKSSFV